MKGKKFGGRVRGTPNKATASVKELARQYSDQAIATLVSIMQDVAANQQARIAAANSLLDRAHGKPPQAHTGEDGIGPIAVAVHHHHAN